MKYQKLIFLTLDKLYMLQMVLKTVSNQFDISNKGFSSHLFSKHLFCENYETYKLLIYKMDMFYNMRQKK